MAEAIDIRELNIRIEQQSGFVQNCRAWIRLLWDRNIWWTRC